MAEKEIRSAPYTRPRREAGLKIQRHERP